MTDGSTRGAAGNRQARLRWALAAAVALMLVAGAWWAAASARDSSPTAAEGVAPGASPSGSASASADRTDPLAIDEVPDGSTTAPADPEQGGAASGTPGPSNEAGPTPGLGSRRPASPWLVHAPLPDDARARGRLVAGFPREVLPTPRWARVRSSSVTSQGTRLQVTLEAVGGRRDALLEHYRSALVAQGFGVSAAPAVGSRRALVFSRRTDSVVVTLGPTRHTCSLFAVLHAAPHR